MPVVQPAHGNEELPSGQVVRERCLRLDPTTTKTRGQRSDTSDDGRFQRVRGRADSDASRSEKGLLYSRKVARQNKWLYDHSTGMGSEMLLVEVEPGGAPLVVVVAHLAKLLRQDRRTAVEDSCAPIHTPWFQEILQDADERSCTDSKADEKKDVVLLGVLSWSTVRPVYQKLRQAAITTTNSASETSPRTLY
ncbi:hypothetical protein BHE74_00006728 [Ensete ventricosum]|nr:hypothetical protein BHE74_00006728 [Ensete ventricosum]